MEEGTRIAVQGGWRYAFNTRFMEQARDSGFPLSSRSLGGPSLLAVFGYRVRLDTELSIELGWSREAFKFDEAPTLTLNNVPVLIAVRWSPWPGAINPYVGGGVGYFLNFFDGGPTSAGESHTGGPVVMVGLSVDLGERLSLVAEYRLAFARAEVSRLGYVQVGGNTLAIGLQLAFAPDKGRQLN